VVRLARRKHAADPSQNELIQVVQQRHRQLARNRARDQDVAAAIAKIAGLVLELPVSSPAWKPKSLLTAAQVSGSIAAFAAERARVGYETDFETLHVVLAPRRITVFLRDPALRSLERERPQWIGGHSREYVRVSADGWAFEERALKVPEVERAIEAAREQANDDAALR
jgi:hypothetical protein